MILGAGGTLATKLLFPLTSGETWGNLQTMENLRSCSADVVKNHQTGLPASLLLPAYRDLLEKAPPQYKRRLRGIVAELEAQERLEKKST